MASSERLPPVDLKPLLTKLWPTNNDVTAEEISEAISHFFTNQVTEAQTAALLMALHFTKLDFRSDVLAKTAGVMLKAAEDIPVKELTAVLERRGRKEGAYKGGLVGALPRQHYLAALTNNVQMTVRYCRYGR